jgi:tripartite-type tricarboxylate transporter receptor subunit TctC
MALPPAWRCMSHIAAACFILGAASGATAAEAYPQRAVRLIIPYPPGGAGDIVGRMLGAKLTEYLGQQVVVDNRGGGGQLIATQLAAKAEPDGHTLFLSSATHGINPALRKHLPYDTLKDFVPITLVAQSPLVFVAHPSVGVGSIKELVALAKAKPGQLSYGSAGPGTGGHLSVEMLKWMTGTDIVHVPYKGAAPALTDLVGGQLHVICTSPLPAMPHVKAGRLRALAMTSTRRSPSAPDIPTVAETVPGYESTLWYALLAPAGTPDAVVKRVHAETLRALKSPEMSEQLSRQGAEAVGNSPAELQAFIRAEIARWTKVIRAANITAN